AEDGIRDRNVTGVQTCALPIFGDEMDFSEIQMVIARIKQLKEENFQVWDRKTQLKRPLEYSDIAIITRTRSDNLQVMQEFAKARSEERRVGKECRERWVRLGDI